MRRYLCGFFSFALLLSLTACGGSSTGEVLKDSPPQTSAAPADSPTVTDTPTAQPTPEASFEELTVVDNDQCVIRITGLDPDNMFGYTLNAYLENKSSDKTYMFSLSDCAVNGIQCTSLFADEVAPGKKANSEISLSTSALEENGITEFTDIELSFRVYDSNDWAADNVALETIHIYPYGEENAVKFVREAQSTDNVIFDSEAVTVIVTGYEEDGIWGYTVNLFLLNKTDTDVTFSVDEASVNGFMADPFYASTVSAQKCAFSSMSWLSSTFEENNITDVEEIEFLLKAYDANDWTAPHFVDETITLTPGLA